MKVRVRSQQGMEVYELEPGTCFGLLRFLLEEKSGIPAEEQKILVGFPPKALEANPDDTLEALGVRSGDQLIVERAGKGEVKQGHTDGKYIPPAPEKGFFVRRPVPSDNSCLFHTAAYVLEGRSRSAGPSLRRRIAEVVAAHPGKFTEAFLGQPNIAYCSWIQEDDTWGGAIELAILSFVYCTEIVSLDVQTGRMDIYGQNEGYVTRVFVVYTGKHYDAMAVAPYYGASESSDQVMFNVRDEKVMQKARQFIDEE
eukprot:EG_transcript_24839